MRELSMHILDLAQNSIAAGATRLDIEVTVDTKADTLVILLRDNGKGMDSEFLASVHDPFTTTRTTRRVGLGIPMMAETAGACEGFLKVESEPGNGTKVEATFKHSHIDRAPMGDIASTLVSMIAANPDLHVRYVQSLDDKIFLLDTEEIKSQLEGVPINEGPILQWLAGFVKDGTSQQAEIS